MKKLFRRVGLPLALCLTGTLVATLPSTAESTSTAATRPFRASLTISRAESNVDRAVLLSGTVSPGSRGTKVTLQKRLPNKTKWVKEATLRTSGSGRFSYTDRPTTPGARKYRVIVPPSGSHAKGVSNTVGLVVYRWLDLTKVDYRDYDGTYVESSASIDATRYRPALVGYTGSVDGFIDWNFSRKCKTLTARFGNGDGSDDVAIANIEVTADGVTTFGASFGLTQSQKKKIKVRGAFRVAFKWTSDNAAGGDDQSGAEAVMAEPRVLCSF